MTPLDFKQDGTPRDERLCSAAQEYAKKEFGEELRMAYYSRVWCVEAIDGENVKVVGITAIRSSPDIPIFHITPVSENREGFKIAEEATALMYFRLNSYLADLGNRGATTMIYVAPDKERLWRRFLKRVCGKPANRYEVQIL